jgi:3-phosphoshikimate 1-carboxyvinyltransferase
MNRPLKELEEQLRGHGCTIDKENGKIHISGRLCGGKFTLPGDVSSQYISGLLFALPLLREDSEICVSGGLQSRPYVEMTTDALKQANITVEANYGETESVFRIKGNQKYELSSFGLEDIEGDWSNGAFWLVADALGAKISCIGLREDSVQGDRRIKELIDAYSRPGEWIVDVGQTPDLVPEIALLAMARIDGELTKITNGKRLRMKESDRIESVVTTVNHLGGNAKATEDEIHIVGTGNRKRRPLALIDSFNDHRIVMMASIGALLCDGPVEIIGSQAVRKSYPGFFEDYKSLGGRVLTE